MTITISIIDVPVFSGISRKEKQALESLSTRLDFAPGETIVGQGRHGQEFGSALGELPEAAAAIGRVAAERAAANAA